MAKGAINLQKESGGVTKITSTDGIGNTEVVVPESGNIVSVDTAVTDNAIARYDGTTGKLQNSGVVVDDNGNVGIGVIPSAWGSSIRAIEQGNRTALFELNGDTVISNNAYYTGTGWIKKTANACSMYDMLNGAHYWSTAPSGVAGSMIAWTNAMALDVNGNLLLISGTGALGYGAGAGGAVTQLTSKSTAVTLNKPSGLITMNNAALAAGASVTFVLSNNIFNRSLDSVVVTPFYSLADSASYRIECIGNLGPSQIVFRLTNITGISLSEPIQFRFCIIKGATS